MKNSTKIFIVIGFVLFMLITRDKPTVYTPNLSADINLADQSINEDPFQQDTAEKPFQLTDEYKITPLADFSIKAKVLSKRNYHFGRESDLSPTDLAMGWREMSNDQVLETINIRQSNRWYYWRTKKLPIPRKSIETQSANMHIIPFDDRAKSQLKAIDQGDIVQISGYLVRVDADDGWHWVSSLTRNDTGGRACEVVLARYIIISE